MPATPGLLSASGKSLGIRALWYARRLGTLHLSLTDGFGDYPFGLHDLIPVQLASSGSWFRSAICDLLGFAPLPLAHCLLPTRAAARHERVYRSTRPA